MSPSAARARPRREHTAVARRYELRWPSFVYVATSLFLAIGAFNSQNNLLYWMFGVAVCAVMIGGVISGSSMMGLEVRREVVPPARAGQAFTLRYEVHNPHRLLPVVALVIEEIAPRQRARDRRVDPGAAVVAHCGPRERVLVAARGQALARGEAPLELVRVTTCFPFGLVRKVLEFRHPATMLVLPPVVAVKRGLADELHAGSRLESRAVSRAGAGEEFFGLRSYTPGDPMRRIAWRRSAAIGTLVVQQTAAPTEPRVWIELDPRVGALGPERAVDFERAIAAAASLAHEHVLQGRAVGLRAPWAALWISPSSGRAALDHLMTALARLHSAEGAAPPRRPTGREPGATVVVSVAVETTRSGPVTLVDGVDVWSWAADPASLPGALAPEPRAPAGKGAAA